MVRVVSGRDKIPGTELEGGKKRGHYFKGRGEGLALSTVMKLYSTLPFFFFLTITGLITLGFLVVGGGPKVQGGGGGG